MTSLKTRLDRRHFLGAAAIGAAGVGLVACGDDDDSPANAGAAATPEAPRPSGTVANPRDATLPPPQEGNVDLTLTAEDTTVEVAAGVPYQAWTYEGQVPAPVLHLRQGTTMDFRFVNNGAIDHSIDFHAAMIDWEVNYRSIGSGEELTFTWTAEIPGVYMYHCGTPPVLHHIGNGMYGSIIIQPADGYQQPADREFWLVQSEFYLEPTEDGGWTGSMDKMKAVRPDILAWNGTAFQYRDNPLQAKVGERVRLYIMNAGPTLWSAFHVIGAMFDVSYVNGHPRNPLYGLQTLSIAPGDGAVVDLVIPAPGKYPIVSHSFAYTELGVVGLLQVTE
jgi:nitrite reductase (NO-forming)